MLLALTWKKKPFLMSMSLTSIRSYESSCVFEQSISFALPDEETRTDQDFFKSRCPALYQTLEKRNAKEENGYNLNPLKFAVLIRTCH